MKDSQTNLAGEIVEFSPFYINDTKSMMVVEDEIFFVCLTSNTIVSVYNKYTLQLERTLEKKNKKDKKKEEDKEEEDKTLEDFIEENPDLVHKFNTYEIITDGKHLCIFWTKLLTIDIYDRKTFKKVRELTVNCSLEGETQDNKSEETLKLKDNIENASLFYCSFSLNEKYFTF